MSIIINYLGKDIQFLLKKAMARISVKRSGLTLVYQMGKVGSVSIHDSLKSAGVRNNYHIHRLNPANIDRVGREYDRRGAIRLEERMGRFLYELLQDPRIEVKAVSMVRRPVDRNVSAFFQNYESFTGRQWGEGPVEVDKLGKMFLEKYKHDVPLKWFDVEMKPVTGIDVYDHDFQAENGCRVLSNDRLSVLLMKCEISDERKEQALKEFFGLDHFEISRSNVGSRKSYGAVYDQLLSKFKLPESYVRRMSEARYTRHFYSEAEIEDMRERWQK